MEDEIISKPVLTSKSTEMRRNKGSCWLDCDEVRLWHVDSWLHTALSLSLTESRRRKKPWCLQPRLLLWLSERTGFWPVDGSPLPGSRLHSLSVFPSSIQPSWVCLNGLTLTPSQNGNTFYGSLGQDFKSAHLWGLGATLADAFYPSVNFLRVCKERLDNQDTDCMKWMKLDVHDGAKMTPNPYPSLPHREEVSTKLEMASDTGNKSPTAFRATLILIFRVTAIFGY